MCRIKPSWKITSVVILAVVVCGADARGQARHLRPATQKQPAATARPVYRSPAMPVAPGPVMVMPTPYFAPQTFVPPSFVPPRGVANGQSFPMLSGMGAPSLAGMEGYFMRAYGNPIWNPFGLPIYPYGYGYGPVGYGPSGYTSGGYAPGGYVPYGGLPVPVPGYGGYNGYGYTPFSGGYTPFSGGYSPSGWFGH